MPFAHGRLQAPDTAPSTGEDVVRLADIGHAVVDQILSGRLDRPIDYRQDVDEWVVVLHGGATLEVGGDPIHLGPGDWVLLPAGIPHRLVETQPATSWLTVTSTVDAKR
ncbi:MAG TPA: cupin domain-containing protein [Acidimicrobiales bacterium]|nr:cupin domain-containing protein [Acidimicrobiales bacterium]